MGPPATAGGLLASGAARPLSLNLPVGRHRNRLDTQDRDWKNRGVLPVVAGKADSLLVIQARQRDSISTQSDDLIEVVPDRVHGQDVPRRQHREYSEDDGQESPGHGGDGLPVALPKWRKGDVVFPCS